MVYPPLQSSSDRQTKPVFGSESALAAGLTKDQRRPRNGLKVPFQTVSFRLAIIVGYGLVQKKMWFWLQSMSYNSLACTSFYTNAALL